MVFVPFVILILMIIIVSSTIVSVPWGMLKKATCLSVEGSPVSPVCHINFNNSEAWRVSDK